MNVEFGTEATQLSENFPCSAFPMNTYVLYRMAIFTIVYPSVVFQRHFAQI
jgi:hypothetical protein